MEYDMRTVAGRESEASGTRVSVRPEAPADYGAIRAINEAAFGGREEADLVESLRAANLVLLSLVADRDAAVVGHILFSRMSIDGADGTVPAVALAPMAVAPGYQRQGIGGQLIRDGIDRVRAQGERIVIVVGHPEYYPRFGFASSKAQSLENPFPPEAFMALELVTGALDGVRGRVRYPDAFGI